MKLDTGETYNVKSLIKNAKFTLTADGKLSSQNTPDPLVLIGGDDEESKALTNLNSVNSADSALILDTKNKLSLDEIKQKFASYVYLAREGAVMYDARKRETRELHYKAILADMEVNQFPITTYWLFKF